MTCETAADAILEGDRSDAISSHVARCAACAELLGDVRRFETLVHEARAEPVAPTRPHPALVIPVPRRRPAYARALFALAALVVAAVGVWAAALDHGESPARAREAAADPAREADPVAAPLPSPRRAPSPPRLEPRSLPRPRTPRAPEPAPATAAAPLTASIAPATAEPSAAQLRAIVQEQSGRMQDCYEHALSLDPTLGTVRTTVTATIGGDGRVTSVAASGSVPSMVRRCIDASVRPLEFPPSEAGLEVSVPLRFEMRAAP